MAIAQAICTAFKKQLLDGDADFDTGGDKFKLALYLSTANLSASATAYTATGKVLIQAVETILQAEKN